MGGGGKTEYPGRRNASIPLLSAAVWRSELQLPKNRDDRVGADHVGHFFSNRVAVRVLQLELHGTEKVGVVEFAVADNLEVEELVPAPPIHVLHRDAGACLAERQ